MKITLEILRDCYIARDPEDPTKVAVWHPPADGPHRVVMGGLENRRRAEMWLESMRGQAEAEARGTAAA
ncbi:MAG TPA: hypothetical protein VF158_10835 [Longimicrobiales bacterium]